MNLRASCNLSGGEDVLVKLGVLIPINDLVSCEWKLQVLELRG